MPGTRTVGWNLELRNTVTKLASALMLPRSRSAEPNDMSRHLIASSRSVRIKPSCDTPM